MTDRSDVLDLSQVNFTDDDLIKDPPAVDRLGVLAAGLVADLAE